jgi:hypothetical protein
LLRALQERKFERVGGRKPYHEGIRGDEGEQIPGSKETGDNQKHSVWKAEKTRDYSHRKRLILVSKIIHLGLKFNNKISY